jgi:hypothetical protein
MDSQSSIRYSVTNMNLRISQPSEGHGQMSKAEYPELRHEAGRVLRSNQLAQWIKEDWPYHVIGGGLSSGKMVPWESSSRLNSG